METLEVELNTFYIVMWPQDYGRREVACGSLNETAPQQAHMSEYLLPS